MISTILTAIVVMLEFIAGIFILRVGISARRTRLQMEKDRFLGGKSK